MAVSTRGKSVQRVNARKERNRMCRFPCAIRRPDATVLIFFFLFDWKIAIRFFSSNRIQSREPFVSTPIRNCQSAWSDRHKKKNENNKSIKSSYIKGPTNRIEKDAGHQEREKERKVEGWIKSWLCERAPAYRSAYLPTNLYVCSSRDKCCQIKYSECMFSMRDEV